MTVNRRNLDLAKHIISTHGNFVPFAFNLLKGTKYIETPFDNVVDSVLDKTFTGEIKRLIINIPPRHSKTLKAVQAYIARGFALNNRSCFVHASYSEKLVNDNSVAVRDIINHPDYQRLFPHVTFKQDTNAKGLWKTKAGGTFLASPSGGAITGFGAGIIGVKSFSGALIIDDPLKPDDAHSDTKREFINQRWENTFKSRLADQNTPVIVIMQRIHEEDFTYELLEGDGATEDWYHLVLPAYIDNKYEYTQSGKYIEHNLPDGALWGAKFSDKQAKKAMSNIQWSQEPTPAKGEVYEREWFNRYTDIPRNIKGWSIYCDTASKINKYNDYSVFQLWGQSTENYGYWIDGYHEKVEIPFLMPDLINFYIDAIKTIYPDKHTEILSSVRKAKRDIMNKEFINLWSMAGYEKIKISIEDKDSGQGLIQSLRLILDDNGRKVFDVVAIQRREGKYARAQMATDNILEGNIYIRKTPEGDATITECTKFKKDDSHKNDDRVDPLNDFINFELPKTSTMGQIVEDDLI